MLKKTKKCMGAILAFGIFITGIPMNTQAETNSQKPAIEVTFSSYSGTVYSYRIDRKL